MDLFGDNFFLRHCRAAFHVCFEEQSFVFCLQVCITTPLFFPLTLWKFQKTSIGNSATTEDDLTKNVGKILWVKFTIAVDAYLVMHNETHAVSLLQNNAVCLFHPEVETCRKEWYPSGRCTGSRAKWHPLFGILWPMSHETMMVRTRPYFRFWKQTDDHFAHLT